MKTKLIPTQNSLRELTRRAMIDLLNQQLADLLDLGLQAKQVISPSHALLFTKRWDAECQ